MYNDLQSMMMGLLLYSQEMVGEIRKEKHGASSSKLMPNK